MSPVKYTTGFLDKFKPYLLGENKELYNKYHHYIFFPEFTNMDLKHLRIKNFNQVEWEEVVVIWKEYITIR
jgi:hypothetical protein